MHNLLRCRRGTAAFVTVVALVPLIGVVALGGEAGSWYVTKQHAQNAADAAAYSGGLRLACSISKVVPVIRHKTMSIVANNLPIRIRSATLATRLSRLSCAAQPPTGTTQTVQIDQPTSSRVRAIVSQQQPTYLAKLLGLSTVNIGATAIAQVHSLTTPACALALTGSISFQGSPNIIRARCSMASNDTANRCTKLHRRRDDHRSRLRLAIGCRRLHRFIDILWRFIHTHLYATGHQSLLCA